MATGKRNSYRLSHLRYLQASCIDFRWLRIDCLEDHTLLRLPRAEHVNEDISLAISDIIIAYSAGVVVWRGWGVCVSFVEGLLARTEAFYRVSQRAHIWKSSIIIIKITISLGSFPQPLGEGRECAPANNGGLLHSVTSANRIEVDNPNSCKGTFRHGKNPPQIPLCKFDLFTVQVPMATRCTGSSW
jgi:hypothetical protein